MPLTFNELQSSVLTGVRESPVIDISGIRRVRSSILNYGADLPTGTTCLVETNVSFDGEAWVGWKTATSGNAIPDITPDTYPKKIQTRVTLTTDSLNLPVFKSLTFELTPAINIQTWTSEEINTENAETKPTSKVSWVATSNSGIYTVYTRYAIHDGEWSNWVLQANNGSVVSNISSKLQFKIDYTPGISVDVIPVVSDFKVDMPALVKRGLWTSDIIDVSQSNDQSTGKVAVTGYAYNGHIQVFSRSKDSGSGTFSTWSIALADGTLTHEPDNFVQLRLLLSGDVRVDDVTLSFDGVPSVIPLASGMSLSAEYDFTTLRDDVIIVNKTDLPRKWDAVTDSPVLLGGNPPFLSMVETHNNRLWGVDAENKSRVRYSDILDTETWGAFSFVDFNPEDGDYITAILRYGQNLVVSKQRSMALLVGNKSSNYSVSWLDSETGVTGMRGMIAADKYICYVAQDGIRFTDLATSVVSTERLLPEWRKLNLRRLSQASMVYWKNNLFVALPSKDSLVNDQVWVYDFLRNSWSIYKGWKISSWLKFQQYGEEILLGGDSEAGQIYTMLDSTHDDSEAVYYKWRSKDFHFGHPERYKLFRNIYLDIEGTTGDADLEVDMFVDGILTGQYKTIIPNGEGVKHTRRILPPIYNTVLGRILTIEIRTRCGIQGISIEYVVRGAVPQEEL